MAQNIYLKLKKKSFFLNEKKNTCQKKIKKKNSISNFECKF